MGFAGALVSASQEFDESGDGLRQPVQQLFNGEANGIGLVSKAALDGGSVKFPQGFQKGRRSDNRCEIAGRGGEIPKD